MIGIHPSGIGRAVKRLGIEPIRWGNRDKHLSVADVMRLAEDANRESAQTVALRLLEQVVREHPDQVAAVRADIEALSAGPVVDDLAAPPVRSQATADPTADHQPRHPDSAETLDAPVLRAPMEPATARRLVTLYTLPSIHGDL